MDEITLAGGLAAYPSDLSSSPPASPGKNPPQPSVFASYRADIASLPPETVLTRKQNDAGSGTHGPGEAKFRERTQSRREIAALRVCSLARSSSFFSLPLSLSLGKEITG